jgi:hypothetical protein
MKRLALFSLLTLVGGSVAQGCSGSDVNVAENGAGKSNQAMSGSTSTSHGGGNATNGGGGNTTNGGGNATNGGSSTSVAAAGETSIAQGGETTNGVGGESTTACSGSPPLCFGTNLAQCCGNDPYGQATCQDGQWLCRGVPAPGCSGTQCMDLFACGPTLMCDLGKQFCMALVGGINGDQYQCQAYSAQCEQNRTCECQKLPQCQTCTSSALGAMTQSCEVG